MRSRGKYDKALWQTMVVGAAVTVIGCGSGQLDAAGWPARDAGLTWGDGGSGASEGGSCMAGGAACGAQCCSVEQVCVENQCLALGAVCDELWPCPAGYYCDDGNGRCTPGATKCEYRPPVGDFTPQVKWSWTGSTVAPAHNQVMMAPMVANLTDDNGDGSIDRNDVPDIVFNTFSGDYWTGGVLRAISGDGSKEHFAVTDPALATTPGAGVAIADLDGDGLPEIVTCAETPRDGPPGSVLAFRHDGTLKWRSSDPQAPCGFAAPAIADLDGDGTAEVIVRYAVLEGSTGKTRWVGRVTAGATSAADHVTVADIDEDGRPEVVGGNVVFSHDGKVLWQAARPDGYPALADLDGDGDVEIVTASGEDHSLRAQHHDGKPYWGPADINQGQADQADKCGGCGGGPPTIADFDGDGRPEIAAAAGYGYVVFEHDGQPKWFSKTRDLSSRRTGSSVFDFEGDGKAEVVYADELLLRIYGGEGGNPLFSQCNTSGTLWEYPVIVDVDNDGHAEIVVANNNYAFKSCADGTASATGIKIVADAKGNWVRTRRIWNQHTYHVTNIDEDGRVPAVEARNWDNPHLNNFRQNVQPGGLFDAPDATGQSEPPTCGSTIALTFTVRNRGAAKLPPGLPVTLYGSDGTSAPVALQTVKTQSAIDPGRSEDVVFGASVPAALRGQTVHLTVVVDDDGTGHGATNECDEQNNEVPAGKVSCRTIE